MSALNNLIIIVLFGCGVACTPRAQSFKFDKDVDSRFFRNIPALQEIDTLLIDSMNVFRAIFEEKLVSKDGLLEYSLFNAETAQHRETFKNIIGNSQHLYILQLFTRPSRNICIYFSVKFDPDGNCIGFGPSYFGHTRIDQVNFDRELRTKKTKDSFYLVDNMSNNLVFVTDKELLRKPVPEEVQFIRIRKDEDNKIGGRKDLIYDIGTVFNDPAALLFKYVETRHLKP